ncbi:MAG: hypothetical protein RL385_5908 [Pseudomonadota bacterium]
MPHTAMRTRITPWLRYAGGALGLLLVAVASAWAAPSLGAARAALLQRIGPQSEQAPKAPRVSGVESGAELALMSCADAPLSSLPAPSDTPLWCEDTEDGPRCSPTAPKPLGHDLNTAPPAVASRTLPHVGPAVAVDVRVVQRCLHTDSKGQLHAARVERPPRALHV